MGTRAERARRWGAAWVPLLLAAMIVAACLVACSGEQQGKVDVAAFKKMARGAACADIRNRLFVIDEELVLWDRAGSCPDAAYSVALYGGAPDQELCVHHDSIAGPVLECRETQYREMFEEIIANLDKADLGLGTEHIVEATGF